MPNLVADQEVEWEWALEWLSVLVVDYWEVSYLERHWKVMMEVMAADTVVMTVGMEVTMEAMVVAMVVEEILEAEMAAEEETSDQAEQQ